MEETESGWPIGTARLLVIEQEEGGLGQHVLRNLTHFSDASADQLCQLYRTLEE